VNQWSINPPIPGPTAAEYASYWLSVAPDKRHEIPGLSAVVQCDVWSVKDGSVICWIPRLYVMQLTHPALVGALWRPVEAEPTDPFEPKPVNWGDIACRADVSPETIAWAAAYDKKMAEINKKLGR
jgi:hypothetical protein